MCGWKPAPTTFYLTHEHIKAQGPWVTFAPPVRDPQRSEGLWQALSEGLIDTTGSDHGPVEKKLKENGEKNIFAGQFGIPGAEILVNLMLNAVSKGRISLARLVEILSEKPAKLYGLFPKKGCLQIGSDADFTIVDLQRTHTLKAAEMKTSCGWIPYEGWKLQGKAVYTIIRGKIVMREDEIEGTPGYGKFFPRKG